MGDKTLAKMLREEGAYCSPLDSEIVRRLDVLWGGRDMCEAENALAMALLIATEQCKGLESETKKLESLIETEITTLTADNEALRAKNEALLRRIEKLEHPNATYSWGGG